MKKCMSVVATVLAFAFSFLILTVVPISPIWGMIVGVFVGGTVFLSTYIVSRGRDPLRILFVAGLVVATLVISIVHDGQEFVFLRVTFGSATVVLFLATMLALGLSRQTTAATVVAAFILMTPNGVIGQEQLVLADMPHHQQDKSIIEILAGVAVIGLVFGFIINIGIGAKKKCDQMANSATNRIMNEIITEREVVVTNFFLVSSEFGITNQIYPPPWPTNLGRYDMIITNTVTNVVQVSYLPYGTTTNDWSDGSYVVTVASVFNAHPSITMEQEPEDGGNLTPCEFETHLNDLGLSANNMSWSSGGTSSGPTETGMSWDIQARTLIVQQSGGPSRLVTLETSTSPDGPWIKEGFSVQTDNQDPRARVKFTGPKVGHGGQYFRARVD